MKYSIMSKYMIQIVKTNIITRTCMYLQKYPHIESFIFGLSGGADSALVLSLAADVQEAMLLLHKKAINIIPVIMPIVSNKVDEMDRAKALCESFAQRYTIKAQYKDLSDAYLNFIPALSEDQFTDPIRLGNIKARIRMIYLYNLAHAQKGIVLSTDNYTELLLGFWTLHGDVGDFGMIQNLWKTEVFMMLDHLYRINKENYPFIANSLKACRDAIPTDGLGVSESDYAQFGNVSTYEEVDQIFIEALNSGYTNIIKRGGDVPKVLTMYENSMYKRENPYNIPRKHLILIF